MSRLPAPGVGLRRIRRVSTTGVGALALAGFTMSFGALHALARESGVGPGLAWLWRLVVDGFIVVASLSVLHAVLESRPARYPWCLLLLFSAVSVAGNVAHETPTPVGRLVSAVPPVALVLAFDLLMRQVRRVLEPQPAPAAVSASPRAVAASLAEQPAASIPAVAAGPSPLRLAGATVSERASTLVAHRSGSGQRVTGRWLADQLGISDGYARRLLRQLDQPRTVAGEAWAGGAR